MNSPQRREFYEPSPQVTFLSKYKTASYLLSRQFRTSEHERGLSIYLSLQLFED